MLSKIFLASVISFTSSFWGGNFVIDDNVNNEVNVIQAEQRVISPYRTTESLGVDIDGKSGIVIDQKSGKILFEKDSNIKIPMASLTKVMTAIVLLDSEVRMDDTYVIEQEVMEVYGSDINLEIGEEVRIFDLLHGLLIHSGNDAAMAIARKVGKEENIFVEMMNQKATSLGMTNTKFKNPHGLDQDSHGSSAKDLAMMAAHAYQNEIFRQIINLKDFQFDSVNIPKHHQFENTNKLLKEDYFLIKGGKTGFTDNAGYCLISYGTNDNNNEIVSVVLGEQEDGQQFHDTKAMIEWTFGNYKWE